MHCPIEYPPLVYLAERVKEVDKEETEVASILSAYLEACLRGEGTEMAAREVALKIDTDYYDRFLPWDPLLKGRDDKGMGIFLSYIYGLIFELAQLIPHDDPRQDDLVQVLVELRRLPPKIFKINGCDWPVYTREPMFAFTSEEFWNANIRGTEYDEWINVSAFFARCVAAGVYGDWLDVFKYPGIDVELGLTMEKKQPRENAETDCRLFVAAKWLVIAGRAIYEDMARENVDNWGPQKWALWEAEFKEALQRRMISKGNDKITSELRSTLDAMTAVVGEPISKE